jgi:hypothetical protein
MSRRKSRCGTTERACCVRHHFDGKCRTIEAQDLLVRLDFVSREQQKTSPFAAR